MTGNIEKVRDWLKALGALCAGSLALEEAEARIAAFAPLLSRAFAGWAFCDASLEAVARGCRWFPAYGELCDLLAAWCAENRPRALPDTATDGLSPMDRVWLAHWRKLQANGFRPEVDFAVEAGKPRDYRAHTASLIRARSPAAWAVIEAAGETGWRVV